VIFPADQIAIYPEYDGLREALIANLESSPAGLACALTSAHVGVFNGVDAAIHAVIHAYGAAGDTLLTTSPTFGYYAPCAGMQGMAIEACAPRDARVCVPDGGNTSGLVASSRAS
jgi:histidinol-phosphate aminotransferase